MRVLFINDIVLSLSDSCRTAAADGGGGDRSDDDAGVGVTDAIIFEPTVACKCWRLIAVVLS